MPASETVSREGICSVCHHEMYYCSNGMYSCRNSDCPPGTKKAYEENLEAGKQLLEELQVLPPCRFATVADLAYVVELCNENVPLPDGEELQAVKDRLRSEVEGK